MMYKTKQDFIRARNPAGVPFGAEDAEFTLQIHDLVVSWKVDITSMYDQPGDVTMLIDGESWFLGQLKLARVTDTREVIELPMSMADDRPTRSIETRRAASAQLLALTGQVPALSTVEWLDFLTRSEVLLSICIGSEHGALLPLQTLSLKGFIRELEVTFYRDIQSTQFDMMLVDAPMIGTRL